MGDSLSETDRFVRGLQQLRPERSNLDPREAFFQAGFEACRTQMESRGSRRLVIGIAAATTAFFISVSASYHVGRVAGVNRRPMENFAQTDRGAPAFSQAAPAVAVIDNLAHRSAETISSSTVIEDENGPQPNHDPVELAKRSQRDTRGHHWMNPLADIARSTQLDRLSEPILSTSHATLFTRQDAIRNLSEFPFVVTMANQLSTIPDNDVSGALADDSFHPLAVGDFHTLVIGQEAAR